MERNWSGSQQSLVNVKHGVSLSLVGKVAAAAGAETELHNQRLVQAVAKGLSSQQARQKHGAQVKLKQRPSL